MDKKVLTQNRKLVRILLEFYEQIYVDGYDVCFTLNIKCDVLGLSDNSKDESVVREKISRIGYLQRNGQEAIKE